MSSFYSTYNNLRTCFYVYLCRDIDKPYLPLVLTTFGDHLLHHLFPCVDHSKLPLLYPALRATCAQFGEVYPPRNLTDMVVGLHRQLARVQPRAFKKQKTVKAH